MKNVKWTRRMLSLLLAASLCMGVPVSAAEYNDFDYITGHVNLEVPGKLWIARPTEEITTSVQSYYIMGGSDPNLPLTMNGEAFGARGVRGSFAGYVQLEQGERNVFTFEQGDERVEVVIIQGKVTDAATTEIITRMSPEYDSAGVSGETLRFSCVAPGGAEVVARVGGREIQLRQAAATSKKGVPATFVGEMKAPAVNGTKSLGNVTYILNGQETFSSAGKLFVTEELGKLAVEVKNSVTSVYKDEQKSAFIEAAKKGSVDLVTEMTSTMYKLATGGWVLKESVQPLVKARGNTLDVEEVSFGREMDGKGELFTLAGSGKPMFRAYMNSEGLNVKLFNTTLSEEQAAELNEQAEQQSRLFTGVVAETAKDHLILTFPLALEQDGETLWGYDIGYGADGGVEIYAKCAPKFAGNTARPLTGVTIVVDAGHGGTDPGALGIQQTGGAVESEITLATALAVQKRLEGLGAEVVLCRTDDSAVTLNERMDETFAAKADLFLSLHCNSVGYDGGLAARAAGTEVFYYEGISKGFAEQLSANIAGYNERTNRGAKFSNYRVTMNTYAPSVLVEIGFLTNPVEYDQMTTRQGIYNTANAVSDSVRKTLGW